VHTEPLTILAGATAKTKITLGSTKNFSLTSGDSGVQFDPTGLGDAVKTVIKVKPPPGPAARKDKLEGKSVKEQGYLIDKTSFNNLLTQMANDTKGKNFPGLTAADRALFDTQAERDNIYSLIQKQTTAIFKDGGLSDGIFESSATGANI